MPIAIPFDDGGTAVLVPTYGPDGAALDESAAIEQYKSTGKHFGKFDTPDNARAYAEQLTQQYTQPQQLQQPPAAPAAPAAPPGFQQRWADVESRLPANRPDLLLKAQHALRAQMSAEYTDQLHLQQQAERAQKEVVRAAENEFIADAFSDAPKLSAQAVSVDKRFDSDPEARMRMLALKARLAERPLVDPVVSSTNMHELMRGIAAGDIDRPQIIDAFNAKPPSLSEAHFNFLLKQLDDIRTPEGLRVAKDIDKLLQSVKSSITKSNPLMGQIDASGDLQFGAFEEDVRRAVEAMKREKKSPAEISEFLSAKRFRDNPALLEPYQKTIQQSIQDQARALSRPPPPPPAGPAPGAPAGVLPRLPGESPADYLRRAGGGVPPAAPQSPVFTAPIPPPPPAPVQ